MADAALPLSGGELERTGGCVRVGVGQPKPRGPVLELVSSWEFMNHSRLSKLQSKAPVHGQCQWSLLRRPQSPSCLAPVLGSAEPPSLREWVARALQGLPPFFCWP